MPKARISSGAEDPSPQDLPVNLDGDFVVYWMTATRRYRYNAALERAVEVALK